MFEDLRLFFEQFRNNFKTTGAIVPSSSSLAKAIVKPMKTRSSQPIKVLEVGPGTGVFTMKILKHLKAGDTLHIFELNKIFYEYLCRKINKNNLNAQGIHYQLFNEDIRTLKNNLEYNYIVSGLPFANFDCKIFCEIMDNYLNHLAPNGVISYFEYILPHRIRMRLLEPAEYNRVRRLICKMRSYVNKYQVTCDHIWLNLPPARARHFKKEFGDSVD